MFALASLPSQLVTVQKDYLLSSATTIVVRWDLITSNTLMVLGYRVYADTGRNDDLRLVYDGSSDPQTNVFTFTSSHCNNEPIDTSLYYRF
jgi:hypothetical protein